MKISMLLNYTGDPRQAAAEAADLESAGVDMIWVAELYSFDAVSILGYLAAKTQTVELGTGIMPLYSRTPALIASTAAGLDAVSGSRFVLGLGASGPQVIEGWHGVPYTKPLTATREVIDICRKVWAREHLSYDGEVYKLPLPADQGTGLGKPIKLINYPVRERIPVYLASLGPKNVALTAEAADGWMPVMYWPERADEIWGADLAAGQARRDPTLGPLEVVAGGTLAITDDADLTEKLRNLSRPTIALYVGGMGAKGRNFYNNVMTRYGYEAEAARIQDLYLDGHKAEAEALVPDEFLAQTSLIGSESEVRERIEAYRESGVTRLGVTPLGDDPVGLIDKIKPWVS